MKKKALIPLILFCVVISLSLVMPTGTAVASPNGGAGDDPPKKETETRKRSRGDKNDRRDKRRRNGNRSGRRKPRGSRDDKKKDEFPRGDHEKQFREGLGEEYRVLYTPHFAVFTNADEKLVKTFIHRMEVTYDSVFRLCDRTGVKIKRPKEKLVVIYNATYDDYNQVCITFTGQGVPPDALGLYYRHPYNFATFYDITTSAYLANLLDQLEQAKIRIRETPNHAARKAMSEQVRFIKNRIDNYQTQTNREVVQHELSHQCLFNFGFHTLEARNPIWLSEGMAVQFETPPGKSGAGLGALNQSRLGNLRAIIKQNSPDLKTFVMRLEHARSIEVPEYAISWGLLNYLLRHYREEFPGFVAAVAERTMEESVMPMCDVELFEKHFGPLDDRFQKRWERYIMSLPYRNEY